MDIGIDMNIDMDMDMDMDRHDMDISFNKTGELGPFYTLISYLTAKCATIFAPRWW
jgi:hypothetical protein